MNIPINPQWQEANWRYLLAAIAGIRERLKPSSNLSSQAQQHLQAIAASMSQPPTLEQLCSTFNLSPFERSLLLLCAGMELDRDIPSLCATTENNQGYPTFNLALATLPEPHWSALIPDAPLRRWKLIEMGTGQTLTCSPLRIDERILHYLIGIPCSDDHILGIIQPIRERGPLVPSHQKLAQQLANVLLQADETAMIPTIQLCGNETLSKQAIVAQACALNGWHLHQLSALSVPTHPNDLNNLILLWRREVALTPSVLLLNCDGKDDIIAARAEAIAQLIEQINSPVVISQPDRQTHQRPYITFEVHPPTSEEQQELWKTSLSKANVELDEPITKLTSQFNLNASTIQTTCAEALGKWTEEKTHTPSASLTTLLWDACRVQVRPQLDDLAQRIEPAASWNDLVLPDREINVLRRIAAQVEQRRQVYEDWGFRKKSDRGLGISALFAGMSGTGKTMSAEVLAQDLRLDLYRIDLSSVVSKYIGETEKNLQRIFDAAESGAVILLFDEADALFGKRSDVKDSHDRYANMEVSYLLQRMEAYQGLAILTTNLKDSLDTAFLRRLRFVVKFPFPDVDERVKIWQRVFPQETPTQDLDFKKLAKLNVSGGNIRNIALNATFLAAHHHEPVRMKHLLKAAQSEYTKLERTLTEVETRGWVIGVDDLENV